MLEADGSRALMISWSGIKIFNVLLCLFHFSLCKVIDWFHVTRSYRILHGMKLVLLPLHTLKKSAGPLRMFLNINSSCSQLYTSFPNTSSCLEIAMSMWSSLDQYRASFNVIMAIRGSCSSRCWWSISIIFIVSAYHQYTIVWAVVIAQRGESCAWEYHEMHDSLT